MKTINKLALVATGFMTLASLTACQGSGLLPGNDDKDEASEPSTSVKRTPPSDEDKQFESAGANSLGIESGDFDLRVVVNSAMALTEEELDLEDGDSTQGDEAPDDLNGNSDDKKPEKEEVDKEKEEKPESTDDDGAVEEPKEQELKACSDHFGKPVIGTHVSGNKTRFDVTSGDLIAVKVTGNQADINILLTTPPATAGLRLDELVNDESAVAASIGGICIIAHGNQPSVNVIVNGITIDKVFYLASGNGATATIEVKEAATLGAFVADLKGNAGQLTVAGAGKYSCDSITVSGSADAPKCGQ